MNEMLRSFGYKNQQVRTIEKDGVVWWVLVDICAILGLTTTARVSNRLDDDEKGMSLIHTPGGPQKMTTVNESGLYSVLLRSDKPEAKPFKRWVTHEVLPAIRRTGQYASQPMKNPVCNVPGNRQAQTVMREMRDLSISVQVLLDQYNCYRSEDEQKCYGRVLESVCGRLLCKSYELTRIPYKVIEHPQ